MQLYRNTHANIYYSCLSVCHWTSLAFSLRWVRWLNLPVAKPPSLLDSYVLGAVISLLRPSPNKESPKFKCYHWCMTELTMCLLRATRLKTRAWILLNFLNLLLCHKHTITQNKNCTWVSLSTKFPKIICWLIYAEICSKTPVFVLFRNNFGK